MKRRLISPVTTIRSQATGIFRCAGPFLFAFTGSAQAAKSKLKPQSQAAAIGFRRPPIRRRYPTMDERMVQEHHLT